MPFYSFSQTVYEPIHSSVYDFLDLMAQKGIIQFHDNIKPVSREYIAEELQQLSVNINQLTPLENKELKFYLKDFGIELVFINNSQPMAEKFKIQNDRESTSQYEMINNDSLTNELKPVANNQPPTTNKPQTTILNRDPYGRLRMFSYQDSLFKINASPILGYELGTRDGAKYSHRWNGLYLYGYLGNNIGYSFRFQDNSEDGTTIDQSKSFTPVTGVDIAKADANNIQYSEVNVNIAYNWSWGDISIGKDFLNWGYGQSGLLVLSDKAPSFPFIRLDIRPAKWFRFNYIHAWLNSGVIDSTSSYATLLPNQSRTIFRSKYLAQHTLTLTPERGLDISLGESIVYSDNLQLSYLVPIMFFRLADHYLSQADNNAGGNSQFFMGVSSRNQIKNTHLFGTLFIDEITIEGIFNPAKQRNQLGFTLGGSVTDLPIDNLTLTAEFTKIFPYVYTHYIPTQTYQNNGYIMGDWMGNNADLVYGAINYRFIRGLQATVWGQYVRKGGQGPETGQYTQPQPPFLYGLRTNYAYLGAELKYEIIHELFARLQFQTTNISTQQPDLTFSGHRMNEFYVALYYGIQ
ncbi:MAG: capsule assembly Wzi family protein [Ignavibacteriaceae bacterium]